jgi:hypothetical protein
MVFVGLVEGNETPRTLVDTNHPNHGEYVRTTGFASRNHAVGSFSPLAIYVSHFDEI